MTTPPCSESDAGEAEQVALRLGEAGYAAGVEPFATRPSADPWLASYAGLSAVAALALYPFPLAAVVVGIAAVVLHARDSDGRPLLRRPSCTAANVVARTGAAARPRLIVTAALRPRPARFSPDTARALTLSLQVLMVVVPAAGAAAWVAEAESELPSRIAAGGVAAAVAVVALALTLYRPPDRTGAAEPPSAATALLFELAPLLRDEPVWLVVTGAPESGTAGIEALLDEHPEDVAGAAWLNLEPSPDGAVVAVSEEGTWRERRADRWLMGAAEEVGADVRPYRAAPTNATPLLARRRRALTLSVPPGPDGARVAFATARAALDADRHDFPGG